MNTMYRVLRGIDPDSIALRLASGGGSFEVRHSATAAPVFRVIDGGATGTITVPDGSITSAKIADGTIQTADMTANSINGDRLLDASVSPTKIMGGATIPADSISSVHIVDGAIQTADIGAAQVTSTSQALGTTSSPATGAVFPVVAFLPEMVVAPMLTAGSTALIAFSGAFQHNTAGHTVAVQLVIQSVVVLTREMSAPAPGYNQTISFVYAHPVSATAATDIRINWYTSLPSAIAWATERGLTVTELKR